MSLNIKNERVHDLVRQAAVLTGKSQTSVVEEALTRYLERLDEQELARKRRLDEIVADMHRRVAAVGGLPMRAEDLYDEHGLPA